MIDRETIERIMDTAKVEEVVGDFVALRRRGVNMIGLCPFHNEKTPSFTVYPSDNSFYCFGCGVGGDAITFVMRSENLDYPAAVESGGKLYIIATAGYAGEELRGRGAALFILDLSEI